MREETFAITPRFGSTEPVSSTMTSAENGGSLSQRSPHFFLPLSLYFCWTHGIPLILQHVPAWCLQPQTFVAGKILLGSAAKIRGDHESAQTHPCQKFANRIDRVLSQHLSAQSQETAQHHSPPKPSSSCTSSWNVNVAGARPCRSRHNLCQRYRPTEE